MKKKAIIFGASGLTGGQLLELLLHSDQFGEVVSFGRKKLELDHPKLSQYLVDSDTIDQHSNLIKGDVLFCCLGTTIRKAGSKARFRQIDFEYPAKLMQIAEANNTPTFAVVSSLGADAASSNFYLRTKGEMEQALLQSAISSKVIVRPSIIFGNRKESRPAEAIGKLMMRLLGWMLIGPARKYRGIHAQSIAHAMMILALENNAGSRIVESDGLQELAGKNDSA
jgi:uncharacterized protein YbjT (DUF2867 family)